jgi:hypothetical protein
LRAVFLSERLAISTLCSTAKNKKLPESTRQFA